MTRVLGLGQSTGDDPGLGSHLHGIGADLTAGDLKRDILLRLHRALESTAPYRRQHASTGQLRDRLNQHHAGHQRKAGKVSLNHRVIRRPSPQPVSSHA